MEDMVDMDNRKSVDNQKGKIVLRDVVEGHKICQTSDAKWLCLDNIHGHFQRPNFYDIGGTYSNEAADFWFLYKTEQVFKLYILHLFVCNRHEGSFTISLCTSNEITINDRNNLIYLNSTSSMFKFQNVIESTHTYLATYSFNELDIELMQNKKLMIAITVNTEPIKETQIPLDMIKSAHDFGQLISDPVGSDFTMESGDGALFQVHKFLLAARSEVFRAMLKVDTAESRNSHVRITDVGKEDLGCLVEYLYTGTISNLDDCNCFNLLILADRYYLKGLKDLVQHTLIWQLSTENALETLMVADMYNSPTVKVAALKFIKANIICLESAIFQEITNVHLLRDLCKYLALKD